MKSIILCEKRENVDYVFSAEQIQYLKDNAGLVDICTYKDIQSGKYLEIDYIFSTWGMPQISETEIKQYLPNLKSVFYAAGTVQSFARPFFNCGVRVFSAWAANAVPVAEYTVSQILLANKGFFAVSAPCSIGHREEANLAFSKYPGNYGETVGIIGAGMIGKLVIRLLKNFNLKVLVFDPFLSDEKAEELGVRKCDLETLFKESFVISNHLANNEQTQGMLDYKLFSLMRDNATFINTGRGAQVVESDLIKVLKNRNDIFALLDVTYPEPPVEDCELYKLSNCILTPHIAGSSGKEVNRMAEYMIEEFNSFIEGCSPRYEVTLEMLKTMA